MKEGDGERLKMGRVGSEEWKFRAIQSEKEKGGALFSKSRNMKQTDQSSQQLQKPPTPPSAPLPVLPPFFPPLS